MNDEEMDRVRAVSTAFRNAIERCKPRLTYIVFKEFPLGACGDTCDLLGRCLGEHGLQGWTYVSARRGERTHAWLEKDGVILDITADQFDDVDSPVLVTRDDTWHRQFTVEDRRQVGGTTAMPEIELELENTYRAIRGEMNSAE